MSHVLLTGPFSKISAKKDVEQHIRHTNTLVGLVSENFKDLHTYRLSTDCYKKIIANTPKNIIDTKNYTL